MKYTEILAANKLLSQKINSPKYNIGILSNVIINSLKDILEYQCLKNNINPTIEIGNYDNITQDSFTFKDKDLLIIFFDSLNIIESVDDFFESITPEFYDSFFLKCKNELDIIFKNLENTSSVIINSFSTSGLVSTRSNISKFENLVNDLNSYLRDNLPKNFYIINIDKIFINSGLVDFIDYRFFHSSKAPYTIDFFKEYVAEVEYFLLKNNGKLKKAIIFDCDNTLWRGILGEDGIDKIDMGVFSKNGKYYNKVQRIITYLSHKGIVIGLCSKNNENDVLEVFKTHKDIFLKEENIVIHKINWNDKATNLKEIAKELNIGLDSIIFVDDSPFEINLIKEHLPEVITIQVPTNIYLYPSFLLKYVYKYFNLDSTKDDLKKTVMYKEQFLRAQEKDKYVSIDQYLTSLEIEITIERDNINQVERLAQLTQKTNQFNLTTKRYTEVQMKNFILSKEYHVFSLTVKDKFGDNGITGLCIINQQNNSKGDFLFIDTLLMSCRIIGRNIEFEFVNSIFNYFKKFNITEVHSIYIPSNKNEQVKDFYEKINFKLISNAEEKKYYTIIEDFNLNKTSYIKVNHN
jgi:FkbH-like protein